MKAAFLRSETAGGYLPENCMALDVVHSVIGIGRGDHGANQQKSLFVSEALQILDWTGAGAVSNAQPGWEGTPTPPVCGIGATGFEPPRRRSVT